MEAGTAGEGRGDAVTRCAPQYDTAKLLRNIKGLRQRLARMGKLKQWAPDQAAAFRWAAIEIGRALKEAKKP